MPIRHQVPPQNPGSRLTAVATEACRVLDDSTIESLAVTISAHLYKHGCEHPDEQICVNPSEIAARLPRLKRTHRRTTKPTTDECQRGQLRLVKGNRPALTPAQQELIGIFAEHLRNLPRFSGEWDDPNRDLVGRFLTEYFLRRNPGWKKDSEGSRYVEDLPAADAARYDFLKKNAGTFDQRPESESAQQVREQAEQLAKLKEEAIKADSAYNALREQLGLNSERILSIPVTPLEIAAQARYEENHSTIQ